MLVETSIALAYDGYTRMSIKLDCKLVIDSMAGRACICRNLALYYMFVKLLCNFSKPYDKFY